MTPPIEIEVKLGLPTSDAHAALLAALASGGAAIGRHLQHNLFFDGPNGEFSAARIALRAREERSVGDPGAAARTLLTMKREGVVQGAVHERIEWEAEIPLTLPEIEREPGLLLSLPVAPSAEVRRLVPGLPSLVCLGGFSNERSSVPLVLSIVDAAGRRQEVRTVWEVDRTDFGPGPVEYELEVELPSSARDLGITVESFHAAVEARLAELGVPWCAQPHSKYARFRRYVLGRED